MGALLNLARGADHAVAPVSAPPNLTLTAAEAVELRRLVQQCGDLYGFSEEEHREAQDIALADPGNALICFRAIAAELGLTSPDDASFLPRWC